MDVHLTRILQRVIARTLEANALEVDLRAKFNFHPRSLVVSDVPHVPRLLSWTKQVLRIVAYGMVLSGNSGSGVEVISLQTSPYDCLNYWLSNRLLEAYRLLIAWLDADLHLSLWLLVAWLRIGLLLWIWLLVSGLRLGVTGLGLHVNLSAWLLVCWLRLHINLSTRLLVSRLGLDLHLDSWLLVTWLRIRLLESSLNNRLLHNHSWLSHSSHSCGDTVMEENNFAQL